MRKFEIIYFYKSPRGEDIVKKMTNLEYFEIDKYIALLESTSGYTVLGVMGV